MATVSAVVIARDEADFIEGCLTSVAWADERLVVLDSATTDDTAVLAERAGARVVERPGQLSTSAEHGARAARCDGLFVDGDERVPPSLAREVRERLRDSGDVRGFWIPRRNVIAGVWVRHAGWWPDPQPHRGSTAPVPLRRKRQGPRGGRAGRPGGGAERAAPPELRDVRGVRAKQARYAVLEARTLWEKGVRAKPRNLVVQPIREFRRRRWSSRAFGMACLGFVLAWRWRSPAS